LKIRLFALARELGLDSKVLIELCDEAGVKLRNALATITPEEKDQVVAFIKNRNGSGASATVPTEELVPVREEMPAAAKPREMRSMASGPRVDEPSVAEDGVEDSTPEPVIVEGVAESEVTTDLVVTESDPEASEAVESQAEPETIAAEPVAATAYVVVTEESESDSREPAAAVTDDKSAVANEPVRVARRPTMHRIRDMKPIASVKDREAAAAAEKSDESEESKPPIAVSPTEGDRARPVVARPMVATPPTFSPPPAPKRPTEREEKVQKPDMALADIVDRQSPLANQMQQLKAAQAEHEGGETPVGRGRGAKKGSLLKDFNDQRKAARLTKRTRRRRRSSPAELKTSAQIELPISVRTLSEAIGRPARSIVAILFKEGRMATINDELSEDDALEIAMELGVDLEIKRGRDIEAELLGSVDHKDEEETLQPRPAVITILGHVDHGKTTLIDRLRQSNITAGEAGGITQHIAAYQVDHEGQIITFVDTPGHAAFGEMRARGAGVTDIIVLVVAADDGVMPQTEECIAHAKSAGIPIIIALNKMDLPGVDDQRTLQQLAQHDLLPAEWGGEYEVVRTSGETGLGIDTLLETLLLTSELHDYKTNPDRDAIGVCLESFRDEGRGVLAWLIVQKGTLRVGDDVLCGTSFGRIRAMYDDQDRSVEEAGPSTPVRVAGLDSVPGAGVHFFVMKDIEEARTVAATREHEGRSRSLSGRGQTKTLEDILGKVREGEGVQELPLILKADTPGSIEALRGELDKFDHPEVKVNVIHDAVGGVNESDVYLASATGAIIIAFYVIAEERAESVADQEGVEIRRYDIIYEITEHIRQALEGLLRPERVEVTTGRAIVLRTFQISRFGTIAGCRVLNGTISRDNRIHVIRDQKVLNSYRLSSLKREKDDAKEVRDGMECGIRLDGFNDIKEGDLLEAFRIDEIQRTLSGSSK
jgi:translation initiation factor IF-2